MSILRKHQRLPYVWQANWAMPGVYYACSETRNRCGWHECLDDSFAELVLYDLNDTSASDDENNALLWWIIIYLENKFQGPYIPKHVSDRQSVVVWRGDNIIAIIIPCNTNAVHMDTIKKNSCSAHNISREYSWPLLQCTPPYTYHKHGDVYYK